MDGRLGRSVAIVVVIVALAFFGLQHRASQLTRQRSRLSTRIVSDSARTVALAMRAYRDACETGVHSGDSLKVVQFTRDDAGFLVDIGDPRYANGGDVLFRVAKDGTVNLLSCGQ